MKTLLIVLATVAVSGCAVYPASYDTYSLDSARPYVVQPSLSIYGASVYGYNRDGWAYPRQRPYSRDLDRDGIPNRRDRDRDGDGVPNRWDNAPNNPRDR